ncbi:MAG: hypothetical protein LBK69_01805 [Syntrophomonadaceae bacterium]|nr:hypothetical protein [Syntrophomonadaceae bacterium]
MKTEVIALSQKQLKRLDIIINKANAGFITVGKAASALGLSARRAKR